MHGTCSTRCACPSQRCHLGCQDIGVRAVRSECGPLVVRQRMGRSRWQPVRSAAVRFVPYSKSHRCTRKVHRCRPERHRCRKKLHQCQKKSGIDAVGRASLSLKAARMDRGPASKARATPSSQQKAASMRQRGARKQIGTSRQAISTRTPEPCAFAGCATARPRTPISAGMGRQT